MTSFITDFNNDSYPIEDYESSLKETLENLDFNPEICMISLEGNKIDLNTKPEHDVTYQLEYDKASVAKKKLKELGLIPEQAILHDRHYPLAIESGISVDHMVTDKNTILAECAKNGELDKVKGLIKLGANVNLTNPLYLASYHGQQAVLQILLEAGADPNVKYNIHPEGRLRGLETALFTAVYDQKRVTAQTLISNKADINTFNSWNETPILLYSRRGDQMMVDICIEAGADPNIANGWHNTALLMASREGHIGIVKKLIKAGANINHKNKDGRTALDLAREYSKSNVNQYLMGLI